jgi:hypothetical protein
VRERGESVLALPRFRSGELRGDHGAESAFSDSGYSPARFGRVRSAPKARMQPASAGFRPSSGGFQPPGWGGVHHPGRRAPSRPACTIPAGVHQTLRRGLALVHTNSTKVWCIYRFREKRVARRGAEDAEELRTAPSAVLLSWLLFSASPRLCVRIAVGFHWSSVESVSQIRNRPGGGRAGKGWGRLDTFRARGYYPWLSPRYARPGSCRGGGFFYTLHLPARGRHSVRAAWRMEPRKS